MEGHKRLDYRESCTHFQCKHMTSCMQLLHIVHMCEKCDARMHTTLPRPSSCPAHLAGRSTARLSCSVEAVSAAQTPSHLRPPSWPSCPPLLPPGGDHHHPPPAPGEETLRLVELEGRSQVPLPLPLPLLFDTILLDGG